MSKVVEGLKLLVVDCPLLTDKGVFIIKFKSIKKDLDIEDIPIDKRKVGFKDFLALTIASIQVLVPVFLAVFAVFSLLAFLLMKFWVK